VPLVAKMQLSSGGEAGTSANRHPESDSAPPTTSPTSSKRDCAVDSMRDGAEREKRRVQCIEEKPMPTKKMTLGGKRSSVFVRRYAEIAFAGETAVGLLYKFCKFILKDPQLNATRFSEHLYVCKKASLEARHDAWTGCKRLYSRPDPFVSGERSLLHHGLGGASLSALNSGTSREPGSEMSSKASGMARYMDSVNENQKAAIDESITKVFVQREFRFSSSKAIAFWKCCSDNGRHTRKKI
jgi:hypothetical protein